MKKVVKAARSRAGAVKRHPFGLPAVLFVSLLFLSAAATFIALKRDTPQLSFSPSDNYIVRVTVDGDRKTIPSPAKTVGEFIKAESIPVTSDDRIEPALDAPITGDNFLINVYRAVPIVVVDKGVERHTTVAAGSPRGAVAAAGVQLHNEDIVMPEPTINFTTQGSLAERYIVSRAAEINLDLYGKSYTLFTRVTTVGELLKKRGVTLGKDDTVNLALDTPLTAGMKVAVVRNGIQVVTVDEDVAPPVRTVIDVSLSFGSQAVRQEGSAGKVTRTYEINIQNGKEVGRRLLQSVTIKEPVERIIAKGNTVNIPDNKIAVMAAAGISPNDYAYVDYIFSRESRWNAAAVNAGGCSGLGQACPGSKLAAACPGWQSDPVCQTRFFSGYASRYGGWQGAYNAWTTKHWW